MEGYEIFDWTSVALTDNRAVIVDGRVANMIRRHDLMVHIDRRRSPVLFLRTTLSADDLILAASRNERALGEYAKMFGIPLVESQLDGFIDSPKPLPGMDDAVGRLKLSVDDLQKGINPDEADLEAYYPEANANWEDEEHPGPDDQEDNAEWIDGVEEEDGSPWADDDPRWEGVDPG